MLSDFPGDVEQDLTASLNLSAYKIEMGEISTSLNLSLASSQKSFLLPSLYNPFFTFCPLNLPQKPRRFSIPKRKYEEMGVCFLKDSEHGKESC